MKPNRSSTENLSLPLIASWLIPKVLHTGPNIVAGLPAMQRGAVWKPSQVELLWDSLVRGFPIGVCLLAPFDEARGSQSFKFSTNGLTKPNHHLLDGQQRATAIALGFLDVWTEQCKQEPGVLWVDLAKAPENTDALFSFRIVTKSHPWGYQRSDPTKRIECSKMRVALETYHRDSPQLGNKRPAELPLTHVWPWDSIAPIPVSLLINAIQSSNDIYTQLKLKLEQLPFWRAVATDNSISWPNKVITAIEGNDIMLRERLDTLCNGLAYAINVDGYKVPALILPNITKAQDKETNSKDPIETIFIRVSTKGTKLEGDELLYSILKSAWPEVPGWIEKVHFRLMSPPRLVLLATRLIQARIAQENGKKLTIPATPTENTFRRTVQSTAFRVTMQEFIKHPDIISTAKRILEESPHGLPPVLSVEIAHSFPDVMLILLRWLERLKGQDPFVLLSNEERRRLVGMISVLAWFTVDSKATMAIIWDQLEECAEAQLPQFFSRNTVSELLKLGPKGELHILPVFPPQILRKFIEDQVSIPCNSPNSALWGNWKWWDTMAPLSLPNVTREWYEKTYQTIWQPSVKQPGQEAFLANKARDAWIATLDRTGASTGNIKKQLLLYAQRACILSYFPDYDPSLPEQLEDTNRPWDYDHIHPNNYVAGKWNIPPIIKNWHRTIGNFRVWPFEANRSDQEKTPRIKFSEVNAQEKLYGLIAPEDKRHDSHIMTDTEWELWKASTPDQQFDDKYLADIKPNDPMVMAQHTQRNALISAITSRYLSIYSEWYNELHIADLMPE